jgi:FAD/FMN-containing dehydrogenase
MPFYQLIGGIPDGPPGPPQLHDYYRCGFVTGAFPRDGAELLVERFRQAPQMGNQKIMNMVMFELPSGVINKVAPEVTAFVHRDASSLLSVCATWYDPEKTGSMPEQEWADTLHADLSKYLNGGVYQNYVNRDLEDWGKAYYGMNLPRLRLVKRAYDPDNVFRYPQGIAAA